MPDKHETPASPHGVDGSGDEDNARDLDDAGSPAAPVHWREGRHGWEYHEHGAWHAGQPPTDVVERASHGKPTTLAGIACPTTTVCETVGTATQHPYNISTNGGSTWTRQLGDAHVGARSWNAVACVSGTQCVAVGAAPPIYLGPSGRWKTTTLPSGTGPLAGAACPSTTRCLAVGQGSSGNGVVLDVRP